MHSWSAEGYRLSQLGRRLDDMLTIVDHQQHLAISEILDHVMQWIIAVDRNIECPSKRGRNRRGLRHLRQIDETNAIPIRSGKRVGARNGDSGFTNATRADDRDQAPAWQLGDQYGNEFAAADDARHLGWQL